MYYILECCASCSGRPTQLKVCNTYRIHLLARVTMSVLGTPLVVLAICKTCGVLNACVDELLKALRCYILPQQNTLPMSTRQVTKLLKTLGLGYNINHACIMCYILFRGVFASLNWSLSCRTLNFYMRYWGNALIKMGRCFR